MVRSNKKSAALVVGAGAVLNAWAPVLRALQPYFDFKLTADGANSVLARIVYLLRWWSKNTAPFAAEQFQVHKDLLRDIRESICRELMAAEESAEICTRPEFNSIVDYFLLQYCRRFTLITTNWDRIVDCAFMSCIAKSGSIDAFKPLHVHGSIERAATLYLPTEVTQEPYRTHEEDQMIGTLHGTVWRGLEAANRVVLYGLSVSPLDAELAQTLAAGLSNENLDEIIVIAPDHELIAHRVNLLLDPGREIKILGYEPHKLGTPHNHTVIRRAGA